MPTPGELAAAALHELPARAIWLDVAASLGRLFLGVGAAIAAGAVLGVALGAAPRRWRAVEPTVDFLRAVPPILTFPFFLLALGYGESARIAAVFFGTVGIVLLQVAAGLAHAPRARADTVRLAGLRGARAFVHLHFFEALPSLFVAARVALAAGLVIVVVTEMLVGAPHGLGARALAAQLGYRADLLWLVILLAGAVGWALSSLLVALERRLIHWV